MFEMHVSIFRFLIPDIYARIYEKKRLTKLIHKISQVILNLFGRFFINVTR